MKLTIKQKQNLSKALFDVGKLVLATVVLGNFISKMPLNLIQFIIGFIIVIFCFIFAIYIDKGE